MVTTIIGLEKNRYHRKKDITGERKNKAALLRNGLKRKGTGENARRGEGAHVYQAGERVPCEKDHTWKRGPGTAREGTAPHGRLRQMEKQKIGR